MSRLITKQSVLYSLILCSVIIMVIIAKYNLSYLTRPINSGMPGLLRVKQRNIDYLFVGSSLAAQAYDIRSIENSNSIKAYNLTYSGLSPVVAVELVEYLTENTDIHIKNLVMEAWPYKIYSPFEFSDTRIFNDSPAEIKTRLIKSLLSNEAFKFASLFELVVSSDNEAMIIYPLNNKIIEKFMYRGSYINKNVPGLNAFLSTNAVVDAYSGKPANQFQVEAIHKLIAICNKARINLVFLEPLLPKPVQDEKLYNSAKMMFIDKVTNAGGTFVESRQVINNNNDPSLFGDAVHLSSKGREIWSRQVLKYLIEKGGA